MATHQKIIWHERLGDAPIRDGQVALCGRINEHGDPQLVVEIRFLYFPTWQKAFMARLCQRWPWLPIKKPTPREFKHEMVWPKFRPWDGRGTGMSG